MSLAGTISVTGLSTSRLSLPLVHPPRGSLPVLLSVAHSGTDYPDWLVRLAAGGLATLEPLEDPLVDRLAWRAIARGIGAVIARAPRAAIDCNREEDELDPMSVEGAALGGERSARLRAGLGLIPSRTPRHGPLWRRPVTRGELDDRLNQVHRPFHAAIEAALDRLTLLGGEAVLIDLHSMPPRPRGQPQAQLVVGDRHGSSAAPWLTALVAATCRQAGYTVELNDPFAGGAIVARHGRPRQGVHAIQLEIDRTTYCQADCRTPGAGFERVAVLVDKLAVTLGEALADRGAIAAE